MFLPQRTMGRFRRHHHKRSKNKEPSARACERAYSQQSRGARVRRGRNANGRDREPGGVSVYWRDARAAVGGAGEGVVWVVVWVWVWLGREVVLGGGEDMEKWGCGVSQKGMVEGRLRGRMCCVEDISKEVLGTIICNLFGDAYCVCLSVRSVQDGKCKVGVCLELVYGLGISSDW